MANSGWRMADGGRRLAHSNDGGRQMAEFSTYSYIVDFEIDYEWTDRTNKTDFGYSKHYMYIHVMFKSAF